MPSPYSGLEIEQIAELGQAALDEGLVTPEEAAENLNPVLKVIGVGKDPLLNARKRVAKARRAPAAFADQGGDVQPVFEQTPTQLSPLAVPKGSGLSMEEGSEEKSGSKTNISTILTMGSDEWNQAIENAAQTSAVQDQMRGVQNMQDLLAMQAEQPVDFYSAPISAWLQSQHGIKADANLAGRGVTPGEQQATLIKGLQKVQDDRRDISKTLLDAVGKQKAGTIQEMLYQDAIMRSKEKAEDPNKASSRSVSFQQHKMDFNAHQRNIQALKKDVQLRQQLTQYNNLANALSNITDADKLTPQQIDETQQAIRANLGIKGTSGVTEREKTFINSLGLNAARIEQFLTGEPADLAKDDELLKHMKDLAQLEMGNISRQLDAGISAITAGNESVYERNPELRQDLLNLVGSYKKRATNPKQKSDDRVRVKDPSGRTGTVPKSKLQEYLGKGYTEVKGG